MQLTDCSEIIYGVFQWQPWATYASMLPTKFKVHNDWPKGSRRTVRKHQVPSGQDNDLKFHFDLCAY